MRVSFIFQSPQCNISIFIACVELKIRFVGLNLSTLCYVQVYQKIEEKRVKMTQSIGSYCNIRQTAVSTRYTDGVAVALDLFENERESK